MPEESIVEKTFRKIDQALAEYHAGDMTRPEARLGKDMADLLGQILMRLNLEELERLRDGESNAFLCAGFIPEIINVLERYHGETPKMLPNDITGVEAKNPDLPPWCLALQPSTGKPIMIENGTMGYRPCAKVMTPESVDYVNGVLGIDKDTVARMQAASMVGWTS